MYMYKFSMSCAFSCVNKYYLVTYLLTNVNNLSTAFYIA